MLQKDPCHSTMSEIIHYDKAPVLTKKNEYRKKSTESKVHKVKMHKEACQD